MIVSKCCHAAIKVARSAGGWWIRGELVTQWYECTSCREACETYTVLNLGDEDEQGTDTKTSLQTEPGSCGEEEREGSAQEQATQQGDSSGAGDEFCRLAEGSA